MIGNRLLNQQTIKRFQHFISIEFTFDWIDKIMFVMIRNIFGFDLNENEAGKILWSRY